MTYVPNKNRTFESILNEGLTTEPASIIFDEVIDDVEDSKYHKNLKELFYFALTLDQVCSLVYQYLIVIIH